MFESPLANATITLLFAIFFLANGVKLVREGRMFLAVTSLLLFGIGCGLLMLRAHDALVEQPECPATVEGGEDHG